MQLQRCFVKYIIAKISAGSAFPSFSWPSVNGDIVTPAASEGWRFLTVYRGKHCPLCKEYLSELDGMQKEFADAGIKVWALSADPIDRARSEADDESWTLPILGELSEEQMRELGLYISSPRTPDETDRNFAEPAAFVLNPEGNVQIIDISNAPFSRPSLKGLLDGIQFVQSKGYPTRGIVE